MIISFFRVGLIAHFDSTLSFQGGSATAPPATALPGGGYPPTNSLGQRICRQCGMAGRYKDGKCVEKWGPGPEGPGTVCDRLVII